MSNAVLSAMGRTLARFLTRDVKGARRATTNSDLALRRAIRPGDVLLVEGATRISGAIKYLTQSTWSHAALHVGPIPGQAEPDGEPHVLVEALLGKGVISSPLSAYTGVHTRICRPVGLTPADQARVLAFARERIGYEYDLRNVIDLARFLLPQPPIPRRWRRRMLSLGSGSPTRVICSTLIAEAFHTVPYPILPMVVELPERGDRSAEARFKREVLHIRHHSLFAPRDFDVSPYFQVVKPTLELGFDYRALTWEASEEDALAAAAEAAT
ncbi:MAG: lipo-like protein [Acetobacteraceae bacterium]|nr:lipo-like protein [Acetobacteraceae bacterium]